MKNSIVWIKFHFRLFRDHYLDKWRPSSLTLIQVMTSSWTRLSIATPILYNYATALYPLYIFALLSTTCICFGSIYFVSHQHCCYSANSEQLRSSLVHCVPLGSSLQRRVLISIHLNEQMHNRTTPPTYGTTMPEALASVDQSNIWTDV